MSRIICYQAGAERGEGVGRWREPDAVEETFVGAFAQDEADVAGEEFGGEGAVVQGCEEGGVDEGAVCCWAELVDLDAFSCI